MKSLKFWYLFVTVSLIINNVQVLPSIESKLASFMLAWVTVFMVYSWVFMVIYDKPEQSSKRKGKSS